MSPAAALEKLRDALQDHVRSTEAPELIITDFAIAYAAIDMHTADEQVFIGTVTSGAPHAALGLAHILTRDLLEGDDDE